MAPDAIPAQGRRSSTGKGSPSPPPGDLGMSHPNSIGQGLKLDLDLSQSSNAFNNSLSASSTPVRLPTLSPRRGYVGQRRSQSVVMETPKSPKAHSRGFLPSLKQGGHTHRAGTANSSVTSTSGGAFPPSPTSSTSADGNFGEELEPRPPDGKPSRQRGWVNGASQNKRKRRGILSPNYKEGKQKQMDMIRAAMAEKGLEGGEKLLFAPNPNATTDSSLLADPSPSGQSGSPKSDISDTSDNDLALVMERESSARSSIFVLEAEQRRTLRKMFFDGGVAKDKNHTCALGEVAILLGQEKSCRDQVVAQQMMSIQRRTDQIWRARSRKIRECEVTRRMDLVKVEGEGRKKLLSWYLEESPGPEVRRPDSLRVSSVGSPSPSPPKTRPSPRDVSPIAEPPSNTSIDSEWPEAVGLVGTKKTLDASLMERERLQRQAESKRQGLFEAEELHRVKIATSEKEHRRVLLESWLGASVSRPGTRQEAHRAPVPTVPPSGPFNRQPQQPSPIENPSPGLSTKEQLDRDLRNQAARKDSDIRYQLRDLEGSETAARKRKVTDEAAQRAGINAARRAPPSKLSDLKGNEALTPRTSERLGAAAASSALGGVAGGTDRDLQDTMKRPSSISSFDPALEKALTRCTSAQTAVKVEATHRGEILAQEMREWGLLRHLPPKKSKKEPAKVNPAGDAFSRAEPVRQHPTVAPAPAPTAPTTTEPIPKKEHKPDMDGANTRPANSKMRATLRVFARDAALSVEKEVMARDGLERTRDLEWHKMMFRFWQFFAKGMIEKIEVIENGYAFEQNMSPDEEDLLRVRVKQKYRMKRKLEEQEESLTREALEVVESTTRMGYFSKHLYFVLYNPSNHHTAPGAGRRA